MVNLLIDKEVYEKFKKRNYNISHRTRELIKEFLREHFRNPQIKEPTKIRVNIHIDDEWSSFQSVCRSRNERASHIIEELMRQDNEMSKL